MIILYLILTVAALFVITDLALKHIKLKNEYARKLIHAVTGLAAFTLPYFLDRNEIIWLCAIFILFLLSTRHRKLLPGIHAVERTTHGEFYFPIGLAISAYFFLPENILAFQFGCLVLGLSDTTADIIGNKFGRHKIPLVRDKSFEGSIAFFITTFAIFLGMFTLLGHANIYQALGIALALTIIESLLSWGLDNLFLPAVAAGLIILIV